MKLAALLLALVGTCAQADVLPLTNIPAGMDKTEALDKTVPDWRGFTPRFKVACVETGRGTEACTAPIMRDGAPAAILIHFRQDPGAWGASGYRVTSAFVVTN